VQVRSLQSPDVIQRKQKAVALEWEIGAAVDAYLGRAKFRNYRFRDGQVVDVVAAVAAYRPAQFAAANSNMISRRAMVRTAVILSMLPTEPIAALMATK
jgi:hypothetical protein